MSTRRAKASLARGARTAICPNCKKPVPRLDIYQLRDPATGKKVYKHVGCLHPRDAAKARGE